MPGLPGLPRVGDPMTMRTFMLTVTVDDQWSMRPGMVMEALQVAHRHVRKLAEHSSLSDTVTDGIELQTADACPTPETEHFHLTDAQVREHQARAVEGFWGSTLPWDEYAGAVRDGTVTP